MMIKRPITVLLLRRYRSKVDCNKREEAVFKVIKASIYMFRGNVFMMFLLMM